MPDLQDGQTAASSPATPTAEAFAALDATQRHQWELSGEWPLSGEAPVTPETTTASEAASQPAQPADQAASTDASTTPPASEPGAPRTHKNAQTRKDELSAEIQSLLEQRAQLRRELDTPPPARTDALPANSSPATVAEFPPFEQWATTHPDQSYEQYTDARTDYRMQQHFAQQREQQQQATARQAIESRAQTFRTRIDSAMKGDPGLYTKLDQTLIGVAPVDALPPGVSPTPLNHLAQQIVESESPAEVLLYLSQQPAEVTRLASLSPFAIAKAIGAIEARLSFPASSPVKTLSDAPPPPTKLGTKAAQPSSDVEAALKNGDFVAYAEAQNRAELATHR